MLTNLTEFEHIFALASDVWLLAALFIVLTAIFSTSFLSIYREVKSIQLELNSFHEERVREFSDLKQLCESSLKLQENMLKLYEKLQHYQPQKNKSQDFLMRSDSDSSPYQKALKMIEMGVSLSEVTATCCLKPQEAELLWSIGTFSKASQIAKRLAQSP